MIEPKERPLICTPQSVAGILARIKTQTRRVMKEPWKIELPLTVRGDWPFQGTWAAPGIYEAQHNKHGAVSVKATSNGELLGIKPAEFEWVVPWGRVGDRLWIKEPWRVIGWDDDFTGVLLQFQDGTKTWRDFPEPLYWRDQDDDHWTEWLIRETERIAALPGVREDRETGNYQWENDDVIPWKSPLFMPKWATRAVVEIVRLRVQWLQEISEEDAKAEGVQPDVEAIPFYGPYKDAFRLHWDSINARRGHGWDVNDFVCAIDFKLLTQEEPTHATPNE